MSSLPPNNNTGGPGDMNTTSSLVTELIAAMRNLSTSASSSNDSGQPSLANGPPLRLRNPETYDGERNVWKIDGWMRTLDRYCMLHGWTEEYTFLYATTLLRGRADAWFQVYESSATGDAVVTTWSHFKQLLASKFRPVNAEDLNRDRLYSIKQTGSVQSYVEQFTDICLLLSPTTGMSAQDVLNRFLTDIFFRGLKNPEIVQRIRSIPIEDRTLEIVCKVALDYEAAYNPSHSRAAIMSSSTPSSSLNTGSSTAVFDDPMELDAIQDRSRSGGRRFNGRCNYCHRVGHKIAECRTRANELKSFEEKMSARHKNNNNNTSGSSSGSGTSNNSSRRQTLNAVDQLESPSESGVHNNNNAGNNVTSQAGHYSISDAVKSVVNLHNKPSDTSSSYSDLSSLLCSSNSLVQCAPSSLSSPVIEREYLAAVASSSSVPTTALPLYSGDVFLRRDLGTRLPVKILFDNGASENYISPRIAEVCHGVWSKVVGREVETAGGLVESIQHAETFELDLQGHASALSAFVFDTKFDIILGRS